MSAPQIEVILRRFESPDETRVMGKGKFEIVCIGGLITIAGWSATSRMYLSTFCVRTTMPSSRPTERFNGAGRGLRSSPAA